MDDSYFNSYFVFLCCCGNLCISFTVQGELLIRYAARAQAELRELREQINNTNKEICGTLHIGCSYLISKYILPPLLKKFLQLYNDEKISEESLMRLGLLG